MYRTSIMKNRKHQLLALFLLILPLSMLSQTKYNLNFDDFNPKTQKMPDGWFKWGDFKNVLGEVESNGNTVGKIISDKDGKFGGITFRFPANYAGDTIKLSGRIKYENVKDFVGLAMRIDGDSRKSNLGFKSMQNQKIRGTSDWKEYSIQLPFPSNAKNIIVSGMLGKKGIAWFDDFKVTIDGKDIQSLKEIPRLTLEGYDTNKLQTAISKSAQYLDLSNENTLRNSLNPLLAEIGDKKVISIGESTHGTSEFYRLREIITKRLIKEKGFKLVILENPYDDIEILNRDLTLLPLDSLMRKHLFSIYQTEEMKSFLQWYKDNRSDLNFKFKGCDDSYWVFHELLNYQIKSFDDAALNKLLNSLKAKISKSSTDNVKKGYKIHNSIYNNILEIENHLKSTDNLTPEIDEILFNGKSSYINYIHIKNNKPIQTRDEIMAERVKFLAKNTNSKIIMWAHNAHISNQIITENEIGIMGRDLKKEFGNDYYSIGLMTLKGNYSYMDEKFINGDHNFKERLRTAPIQPTEKFLWENAFAQNNSSFYTNISDLKDELNTDQIFGPTKLIGYGKESEDDIYYLPLTQNFDALIFIAETNSTIPIFK